MGKRSATETVVAVVQAFLQHRTWKQAELAEEVELTVPALRARLEEMERDGIPLVREEDHPHVYWSVPRDWFPGGVVFPLSEVAALLRQLMRRTQSAERDQLIQRVISAAPRQPGVQGRSDAVVTPTATTSEEKYLAVIEDAAAQRVVLRVQYYGAARGALGWRHASPQRVVVGPQARFAAVCHRDGALKWFRLEGVMDAALDRTESYRTVDRAEIERFLRESFDGFRGEGGSVRCAFTVREPESRWVETNLPEAMEVDVVPGGLRFSKHTAGVLPLARFVVGLGDAARVETSELREMVQRLARGALEAGDSGSSEGGAERAASSE